MHKGVASPAQPRHAVQLVLGVPPALQHAFVRALGDEVMVCERDPGPSAELAFRRAGCAPDGRRRRDGRCVRRQDRCEQVVLVGRV